MKPKKEYIRKLYEYDALNLKPPNREDNLKHNLSKHKQKQKDLEVVFNPKAHREYLTGFRKRKQERRQEAQVQIKKKAAQERLSTRAERREKLKADLGLPDDYGVNSSGSDSEGGGDDEGGKGAAAQKGDRRVYQGQDLTTTVTMVALDSDAEEPAQGFGDAEDGSKEEEEEEEVGTSGPRPFKRGSGPGRPAGPGRAADGASRLRAHTRAPEMPAAAEVRRQELAAAKKARASAVATAGLSGKVVKGRKPGKQAAKAKQKLQKGLKSKVKL